MPASIKIKELNQTVSFLLIVAVIIIFPIKALKSGVVCIFQYPSSFTAPVKVFTVLVFLFLIFLTYSPEIASLLVELVRGRVAYFCQMLLNMGLVLGGSLCWLKFHVI